MVCEFLHVEFKILDTREKGLKQSTPERTSDQAMVCDNVHRKGDLM